MTRQNVSPSKKHAQGLSNSSDIFHMGASISIQQGAPFAQGPDFCVERHREIIVCRVWLLPQVSGTEAMKLLANKALTLAELSRGDGCKTALILDLRAASSLAGAFPQRRLRGLLKEWKGVESAISIIVGDEVARIKAQEMCTSVSELRVVTTLEDALAWSQLAHQLLPEANAS